MFALIQHSFNEYGNVYEFLRVVVIVPSIEEAEARIKQEIERYPGDRNLGGRHGPFHLRALFLDPQESVPKWWDRLSKKLRLHSPLLYEIYSSEGEMRRRCFGYEVMPG
jgi:hypothetical protein